MAWTFTVDPAATGAMPGAGGTGIPLPSTSPTGATSGFTATAPGRLVDTRRGLGATRLVARQVATIHVGGKVGVTDRAAAVSANFTAVSPDSDGYLTVYPCGNVPNVSTLNFSTGSVTPNQAVVPLSSSGDMCVVSSAATDLLVDVNGALSESGTDHFTPVPPSRILDTRSGLGGSGRRAADTVFELKVRGVAGVSVGATAVAMNVTAVDPDRVGYVTVYPCGSPPNVSNLNVVAGQTRPNLVVVRLSATGTVCLKTAEASTDLIADVAGYLSAGGGASFTPLAPMRVLDTRSTDARLDGASAGVAIPARRTVKVSVAGQRGIPVEIDAVSINITVTGSQGDGYLTAYPCGTLPTASTVNFTVGNDTANAAEVPVDGNGMICLWSSAPTHMIVDVNGVWG